MYLYILYIHIYKWIFKVLNCCGNLLKCEDILDMSLHIFGLSGCCYFKPYLKYPFETIKFSAVLLSYFNIHFYGSKRRKKTPRKYMGVEELTIYITEPSDLL